MESDLPAIISAISSALAVIFAGIAAFLTYRLLAREVTAIEASVYHQVREAWNELDDLMLNHGHIFVDREEDPIQPFVLPDGLPNPDPRLYIAYRFFGTVEMMVALTEDYKLARRDYLNSFVPTLTGVMSMPLVHDVWNMVREQYPAKMQAFVDDHTPHNTASTV